MPGPTAYDVSRAYQALVSQKRQPPRSKVARRRNTSFLSAAKRTFAVGETSIEIPGPGAYDAFMNERVRGCAPVRDSRFHYTASKLPGPADYEVGN